MCPRCDVHEVKTPTTVGVDVDQQVGEPMRMRCLTCDRRWLASDRYLLWPMRVQWRRRRASSSRRFWTMFHVQTVERGYYDIECRQIALFITLGPLQIALGR